MTTPDGRPLVIAHRGASDDLAEHTLGAFERAIADGADGLECDVRLTADGHLVCVHDRTVDRTSDGRGAVSTLELAQLNDLDFASWKRGADPANPAQGNVATIDPGTTNEIPDVVDLRSQSVLTLETLLELVTSYDRPPFLAIETKHPTRYAGFVEERTVETLERFGLARPALGSAPRIRLMSFSAFALRRFGRLAPSLPRVALMDRVPLRFRDGTLPLGVQIAGPSIDIVRAHPRYAERVRQHGRRVYCWTVDEPEDVDRCVAAGIDAIISNRPRVVLEHLNKAT